MDPGIWLLTALVVLFATTVMSVAGFGFGLIVVPLFLFFLEAKETAFYSSLLGALICIPIFWQSRHHANPGIILIASSASIIGLPIGIYLITLIPILVVKIIVAVIVIIFALLLYFGFSIRTQKEWLGSSISGLIGGILMASTGLGGPPVVLFLFNQNYQKHDIRPNLAAYLCICGLASVAALAISKTIELRTLAESTTFIPVLILGYFIGIKIFHHINQSLFRKMSFGIIVLAGIAGIISALFALR